MTPWPKVALTSERSSVPGLITSIPTFQRSSVPTFQASWSELTIHDFSVPAFQHSSVPTFHNRHPRYTMEKTNLQVENQNWEEMKAVLNFSSESSDDELSKSYETVISKIISDESPSPEYQLCYVAESGSDSDENCSLFPEVLNVTSQTIIRSNYK